MEPSDSEAIQNDSAVVQRVPSKWVPVVSTQIDSRASENLHPAQDTKNREKCGFRAILKIPPKLIILVSELTFEVGIGMAGNPLGRHLRSNGPPRGLPRLCSRVCSRVFPSVAGWGGGFRTPSCTFVTHRRTPRALFQNRRYGGVPFVSRPGYQSPGIHPGAPPEAPQGSRDGPGMVPK